MRILQVHTRYRQAGGEDAVVAGERSLLESAGHEVAVCELANPDEAQAAMAALVKAPWNAAAARRVVRTAEEFRPDVVHVHNTWFALSPAVFGALKKAGFPTVATIHNYRLACVNAQFYRDGRICTDCAGRFPWRGVVRRCYRDSAAQSAAVAVTIGTHRLVRTWEKDVDVVVALTSFAARQLRLGGVPGERIVVKPNWVRDPGERPAPPSGSDRVLFVGRLSPEKGVEDLIAAWNAVNTDGLRLTIVGDGPLSDRVVATAGSGVEFLGRLDPVAIADLMTTSRALVLPSRWYEGLPMVLLEAMAAGMATVVPAHGALPEVAGEGGIVFPIADMKSALQGLRSDDEVDRLGAASRARYVSEFGPEEGLRRLEAVYHLARHEQG